MFIHFLGANRQVTGSRYLLEAGGLKILIDCGMFQERPFLSRNWEPTPVPANQISHVILTHAHLDHIGLLPRFVAEGYRGEILATAPTIDLAGIVLRDAAKIQMEDAAYKKRRHQREHRKGPYPELPLYTTETVEKLLPRFRAVRYNQPVQLNEQVSITWHDAGHILGSAMLEFVVRQDDREIRIIFSGDIGQHDKPFIRDPTTFDAADFVVMESTYGDRNHEHHDAIDTQLERIVNQTVRRGGNLIVPTFAIERAQELLFHIGRLVHSDRMPDIPIYLDSPMAVGVTDLFSKYQELFDDEMAALIKSGEMPLEFQGLHLVRSVEESKAINAILTPAIILAGSGMCTGGRVKHHLRNNITRHESTVMFAGYQANGTLGRQILDGNQSVRIHGKTWPVRARIEQLQGLSAHADRAGLLRWVGAFDTSPTKVFLTHGEEPVSLELAETLRQEQGCDVIVPSYNDRIELSSDRSTRDGGFSDN